MNLRSLARIRDWISLHDFTIDLMRTAYDTDKAFLNRFDPRVLLIWFLCFSIVPWLFYDPAPLLILFGFVSVLAVQSKVSKYLLLLLALGVISNLGSYAVLVALLSGGGDIVSVTQAEVDAVGALVPFMLKLTIVSILNLTVYSSMSPESLSKGLSGLGAPRQFTFILTYGIRMMPVLVKEYHETINSIRLRSRAPEKKGLFRWRYYHYLLVLSVKAFYPVVFSVAKRSRVTVEALETKGFSESLTDETSKNLRQADLEIRLHDVVFFASSLAAVIVLLTIF